MKKKFKDTFRQLYRNILKILPTKIVLNIENIRGYHKLVNYNKPKYFGEKIQWIKVYGNLDKYTNYVDKYEVRNYVEQKIGSEYLIPLIGTYEKLESIDYTKLPDRFVLKLNTGSGYNLIVNDKKNFDIKKTNKKLSKWLKEDYYKIKKEPQYKNIKKKILCEEYLSDKNGQLLDYKFFCFNGKVEFVEVDFDRFGDHTMNFYDIKWKKIDMKKGNFKNYGESCAKPKNFDLMVDLAQKLCVDFPFVRVDLYNVDGKIYFGELTFTPAGGVTPFKPIEKDIELAKKIKLQSYKSKNVLLFASISKNKSRLDGETIKNKLLKEYLEDNSSIELSFIDTHSWRKNALTIIENTLKSYKNADTIIISASQSGASVLLKFFKAIKCKKPIYYFLIGGSLANHIEEGKQKIETFEIIDKIYVESDILKEKLNQLGLNNVEVKRNFRKIDNFENKYKKSEEVKFVFYGRVVKAKGIEQSIDLVKKLLDNHYKVSLDIYGQVEKEYLEKLEKQIDNCKKIKYRGVIIPNNKLEYEILSQYDVFVLPTEHPGEGLPGALIDSYIAGLAVLVSNWQYAKEYVKDGVNGYIFEYKNYEDMYKKAVKLLEEHEISKFKEESKIMSKNYIVEDVLTDFVHELFKKR